MELLVQSKIRGLKAAREFPNDPMAMTPVGEVEALDFDTELADDLRYGIEHGSVPNFYEDDMDRELGKVTLVWMGESGAPRHALDVLYHDSDVKREMVIRALESVLGPIPDAYKDQQ